MARNEAQSWMRELPLSGGRARIDMPRKLSAEDVERVRRWFDYVLGLASELVAPEPQDNNPSSAAGAEGEPCGS